MTDSGCKIGYMLTLESLRPELFHPFLNLFNFSNESFLIGLHDIWLMPRDENVLRTDENKTICRTN